MTEKLISPKNAINFLNSENTFAVCGFTMMGACEAFLSQLEETFLKTGEPKNLTLLHAAGHSDRVNGIEHLAHRGLVKRIIGSHWGLAPKWGELINHNAIEAHCLPQGQITHLMRAMASGKPGNLSKVGLGTFVDPRVEGGKINDLAREKDSFIDVVDFYGEKYLFYKQIPIDLCVIRGTTADEFGNVTMEDEAIKLEALSLAQATKRYGGKVIVQVKNYVKRGQLNPRSVELPGIFVDHIIVADEVDHTHKQTAGYFSNPALSGKYQSPVEELSRLPLTIRKVIGRRAVKELYYGAVVNLGTGIPGDTIGTVASEEGILEDITLTVESGVIGGIPLGGTDFGVGINADAIIEHPYQFDYYNGQGVDITYMGAAEVDSKGDINVSKFGPKTVGCGGFIDITQNAKKVVFCSTFTAGGLETKISNGKLEIVKEGKIKKFANQVQQITFSGPLARSKNQKVIIVTERDVFELSEAGVVLIEYAPGINIGRDILEQMDFTPIISEELKEMNQEIFKEEKMVFKNEFMQGTEQLTVV
ncbi:acyl CoA:acetate/3-ketoacid CoA transferase [Guptibacillus hwajinpoensis]|uniref:acyl CoA:acetate/3-ketoacid CoA transferase n=1 Tax=Guptibacillus hwajinpoensis TaxID=208199 RepID=UPI00273E9CF1|nr:CoA-transferase [Pseudalkalibacillus hwajinpoensis]WLR61011.1 CoA-transferase [Pseudalkalibacillus hwajinpoensis]